MQLGQEALAITAARTRRSKANSFGGTAYTPAGSPNGPPQVFAGIRVYDGNGHFTQRDYIGNSVPAEFAPPGQETATYTVNRDCTGNDELDINAPVPSSSTG